MVEGVHEPQTLIKVLLSLDGVRRDGMMKGAEIVKERDPSDMAFGGRTQIKRQQPYPWYRPQEEATDAH